MSTTQLTTRTNDSPRHKQSNPNSPKRSNTNSRPPSRPTNTEATNHDYEDEFDLPDEPDEVETEEEDEEDDQAQGSLTQDQKQSRSIIPSSSHGSTRTGGSLSPSKREQPMYNLTTGKKGDVELRADSRHYNMTLLGGVPPSWKKTEPVGVVLCDRAVDTASKRKLELEARLAKLKQQDEARERQKKEMELKRTEYLNGRQALLDSKKNDRAKQLEAQAQVKAAAKEFQLKLELRKNEALAANIAIAKQESELKQARRDAMLAKNREISKQHQRVRKENTLKVTIDRLAQDVKLQAEVPIFKKSLELEDSIPKVEEDEKDNDQDATADDESSSPRRRKKPALPRPFRPPSPIHSSRAIPVEDRNQPFEERLARANIEWQEQVVTDVIIPKRDTKAAAERAKQNERELAALKERVKRAERAHRKFQRDQEKQWQAKSEAKKKEAEADLKRPLHERTSSTHSNPSSRKKKAIGTVASSSTTNGTKKPPAAAADSKSARVSSTSTASAAASKTTDSSKSSLKSQPSATASKTTPTVKSSTATDGTASLPSKSPPVASFSSVSTTSDTLNSPTPTANSPDLLSPPSNTIGDSSSPLNSSRSYADEDFEIE